MLYFRAQAPISSEKLRASFCSTIKRHDLTTARATLDLLFNDLETMIKGGDDAPCCPFPLINNVKKAKSHAKRIQAAYKSTFPLNLGKCQQVLADMYGFDKWDFFTKAITLYEQEWGDFTEWIIACSSQVISDDDFYEISENILQLASVYEKNIEAGIENPRHILLIMSFIADCRILLKGGDRPTEFPRTTNHLKEEIEGASGVDAPVLVVGYDSFIGESWQWLSENEPLGGIFINLLTEHSIDILDFEDEETEGECFEDCDQCDHACTWGKIEDEEESEHASALDSLSRLIRELKAIVFRIGQLKTKPQHQVGADLDEEYCGIKERFDELSSFYGAVSLDGENMLKEEFDEIEAEIGAIFSSILQWTSKVLSHVNETGCTRQKISCLVFNTKLYSMFCDVAAADSSLAKTVGFDHLPSCNNCSVRFQMEIEYCKENVSELRELCAASPVMKSTDSIKDIWQLSKDMREIHLQLVSGDEINEKFANETEIRMNKVLGMVDIECQLQVDKDPANLKKIKEKLRSFYRL